jgi:hypothetical protein
LAAVRHIGLPECRRWIADLWGGFFPPSKREQLQQANREIEERAAAEREQRECLERVVAQMREVAGRLSSGAAEILATASQQAAGASEQMAAVGETSTTVEEVRQTAEQTSSGRVWCPRLPRSPLPWPTRDCDL